MATRFVVAASLLAVVACGGCLGATGTRAHGRRRITYNKYLSREQMGDVIGVSNTNAWAEAPAYTIHTIWAYDNHECVHLYASALGMPVSLLTEGLAVAFQTNPMANDFVPRWSGTFVHDLARTFRTDGRLVPIDRCCRRRNSGRRIQMLPIPRLDPSRGS